MTMLCLLCRRNHLLRGDSLVLHLQLCPPDPFTPRFELIGQCVKLAAFENSGLDPGDIDGRGHLIERAANQGETTDSSVWLPTCSRGIGQNGGAFR